MDSRAPHPLLTMLLLVLLWFLGLVLVGMLACASYIQRVFDRGLRRVSLDVLPSDHPLEPLARDGWIEE